MANEMEELTGFLSSPSPQVKKAAVDIVRGLTGSEDGLQSLASYSNTVIPSLSRLLGENKEVSEPATEALVNLSQNSDLAAKMIEMGLIKTSMDVLYKQGCGITGLLVMLLVNLTQLDAGVESLLQVGDDKVQGLYVMKLVRSFCTSSSEQKDDPFGHVGSILVNVSKHKTGRSLLLDPKRGLLKQIIRQFDSTSLLRKKGWYQSSPDPPHIMDAEKWQESFNRIESTLLEIIDLLKSESRRWATTTIFTTPDPSTVATTTPPAPTPTSAIIPPVLVPAPPPTVVIPRPSALKTTPLPTLTLSPIGVKPLKQAPVAVTSPPSPRTLRPATPEKEPCRPDNITHKILSQYLSIVVAVKLPLAICIPIGTSNIVAKGMHGSSLVNVRPFKQQKVSGTIRNCCFEADNQLQNLLLISEFLWPALLLPVAGNKVYNEQDTSKMPLELASALSIEREPVTDPEIRIQALEAVYLITLQGAGRRAFWSVNGPRILQIGYEEEEDPKVMGAYEQIGSLLVEGNDTEEGSAHSSS